MYLYNLVYVGYVQFNHIGAETLGPFVSHAVQFFEDLGKQMANGIPNHFSFNPLE